MPPSAETLLPFEKATTQASGLFRAIQADAFRGALASLVQGLAAIPSLAPMARLLQRTPDGRQASTVMGGWHVAPGPVQQHARQVLHSWLFTQRQAVTAGSPVPAHHKSEVLSRALELVKDRSAAVSDWVLLAFQIASDLLGPDTPGLADVFEPMGIRDASSMATAVAATVVRAGGDVDLAGFLDTLHRRFPAPAQDDGWAASLLQQYGYGALGPLQGHPTTGSPSPAAPYRTESPATPITIRAALVSGNAVPWCALLSAVSAHFGVEGAISKPPSPLLHHLYISLPRSVWEAKAMGRHSWKVPAGLGSPVLLQSRKRNNEPFFSLQGARTPPENAWQLAATAGPLAVKRLRPPSAESEPPPSSASTEPPQSRPPPSTPPPPTLVPFQFGPPNYSTGPSPLGPPGPRSLPGLPFPQDPTVPFAQMQPRAGQPQGFLPQPPSAPTLHHHAVPCTDTQWRAYDARREAGVRGPGNLWLPTRLPSSHICPPFLLLLCWGLFARYGSMARRAGLRLMLQWIDRQVAQLPVVTRIEPAALPIPPGPGDEVIRGCLQCGSLQYGPPSGVHTAMPGIFSPWVRWFVLCPSPTLF